MSDQLTARAAGELVSMADLPVARHASDETFLTIASGAGFLPRLQLYGANSGDCKRGKIGMGRYGLVRVKDQIEDLTAVCNCLPLSWRPMALRIDGDEITAVYNPQNPEFQKIQEESEEKDTGCMFGPQFLLWLPDATPPTFATFFCMNKTMRREAPNLKGLIGRAATLKSTLIESKKYQWHGPVVVPCSTPFQLPPQDEMRRVLDQFCNPKETEVETAPADGGEVRAR